MKYYRTSDAAVIDISAEQFAALAPAKQGAHRPYSVAPLPAVTSTQKAVPGHVVVTDTTAAKTWTIVDKTQSEIDAEAEAVQSAVDYSQAKTAFNDLRNGVGTAGERLTRIEKVLARLLRDSLLARGG